MSALPDVPELILTERLELRAPALEHVAAVTEAVRGSLTELKPWMPWATDAYDAAGAEQSVRGAIAAFVTKADFRFHMFEKGPLRWLHRPPPHQVVRAALRDRLLDPHGLRRQGVRQRGARPSRGWRSRS